MTVRQNIDANFSQIQQVLASRILPALKQYSVATEPVREAAKVSTIPIRCGHLYSSCTYLVKFWVTFFEQAAQIRVPTYDDYQIHQEQQSVGESEPEHEHETTTESDSHTSSLQHQTYNPDRTASEVSFMPGQAAISSTPATASRYRARDFHSEADDTPSWTASLESPLLRLDREIQSLNDDDAVSAASSSVAHMSIQGESEDVTQRQILAIPPTSSTDKGKGKEPSEALRHNVLKRNAAEYDLSTASSNRVVSPLKFKPKTPLMKTLNPYLPPDSKPSDWGGIVDLRSPTVTTPSRSHSVSLPKFRSGFKPSARPSTTPKVQADDSFDEGFGMSPPITLAFTRLPKLSQTPRKEAAERIMKNLLDVERRGVFGITRGTADIVTKDGMESTLSSLPSPPSLSKYTHPVPEPSGSLVDSSLESLMRRVGGFENYGIPSAVSQASAASSSQSHHSHPSFPAAQTHGPSRMPPPASISADLIARSSAPPDESHKTPDPPPRQFNVFHLRDDEFQQPMTVDEGNLSLDSLDEEDLNNTANPSAAFILASQRASYDDDSDSFGSNQSLDSLNEEDIDPNAPVHPFARGIVADDGDGFEDDSFDDPAYGNDDVEEETLFGVPPAQRLLAQANAPGGQLRILGESLLEDTVGIGEQMARAGRVEESPTPWGGRHGS